ncbi:MAG: heparinase, partial [Armatimonadota bacterium]
MRMSLSILLLIALVGLLGTCVIAGSDDVSHPVFSHDEYSEKDIPALKSKVEYLMSLLEEELVALVPPKAGLYFVGCPNCDGGRQDNIKYRWSLQKPDQIECPHCGHTYPSDEYPMDQSVKVTAPSGKTVEYPYWEDPDGKRYYFEAKRHFIAREQLSERARDMALVYHLTGDAQYARRAALIINRFAEVFPDYVYKFDYPFRPVQWYDGDVDPKDFRSGFRTSRWDWWAYMDIPRQLTDAYDLIYDSGEVEKIPGAKQRIEGDFLLDAAEQVADAHDGAPLVK